MLIVRVASLDIIAQLQDYQLQQDSAMRDIIVQ